MRIAFIIQVHKNPAQLERLLQRLAHPNIDCYVHVDAKCELAQWQRALSLPQVYPVSERANVTWAGWGIIQATLNGMMAITTSGRQYAYITLLSGQDYNLKSAADIYKYLCGQSQTQFLETIDEQALHPMMSKMHNYHFVEFNFPGKYRLAKWLTWILPKRKAPLGLKLYCGSAWWTLTQDCMMYCLEFERANPELRRFFKLTWGADEFIFQTILMNSHYKQQVAGYNLHYIDWSAGKEHPKNLCMEDLDAIMQSNKLFARKVDQDATALLNRIDSLTTIS